MSRTVVIRWSGGEVTGRWRRPRSERGPAVLLAHGAGVDQDHAGIVGLREGIAGAGHPVLTFNYPYKERGRGGPDRQPVLLECHRAAAAWIRSHVTTSVVFAGRSMGGRMASYLAAEGEPMAGLILYAYPLHPVGKPERLRVDHLDSIPVPMRFFSGTRDALASPDELERWIMTLPNATVTLIDGADHGFRVPKRSGMTPSDVTDRLVDETVDWIRAL